MGILSEHGKDYATGVSMRTVRASVGAETGFERGAEGMPEVQKPVLEHAAPKADQNQGLDGRLADASLPESNYVVKTVTGPRLASARTCFRAE
jgi:hypothetical protein